MTSDQCKEYEEASDVPNHTSKWDLEGAEHLKRRHEVSCTSNAYNVCDSK